MTQSTNSKFDTIEALRERAEKAEAENAAANADRIEAQKLGMQAMDENAALREDAEALLQKQMDITLKEYKRAEKAEAENAALRGLLERAKWMELYGEIVAEKNK